MEIIYQGGAFMIDVSDLPTTTGTYIAALYNESSNKAFRVVGSGVTGHSDIIEFTWSGSTTLSMPRGVYRLEIYEGTVSDISTDVLIVLNEYAEVRKSNFVADNLDEESD